MGFCVYLSKKTCKNNKIHGHSAMQSDHGFYCFYTFRIIPPYTWGSTFHSSRRKSIYNLIAEYTINNNRRCNGNDNSCKHLYIIC